MGLTSSSATVQRPGAGRMINAQGPPKGKDEVS